MKNKLPQIIIVDDHALFRNGLKLMIETRKIGNVIAEAENGQQFLSLLETLKPDCILMDIEMPVMNGILATQKAIEKNPDFNILGLSMFGDEKFYSKMLSAGAKGFLLKKAGYSELITGITEVARGNSYISADLLRNIIINKNTAKAINLNDKFEAHISEREFEILQCLANGLSTNEIADQCNLSPKTVNNYRSTLLSKTNTRNTVELVIYALKQRIISL